MISQVAYMEAISAILAYTGIMPLAIAMKPQKKAGVPPSVKTKVKTLVEVVNKHTTPEQQES